MPLEGVACGAATASVAKRFSNVTMLRENRIVAVVITSENLWATRSDEVLFSSNCTCSELSTKKGL